MHLGDLELPVRSARVELRALAVGDAEAMSAYRSIPEVCRYVPFDPQSPADLRPRLEGGWTRPTLRDDGDAALLAVVHEGRLVGDAMLRLLSAADEVGELGYVLHPDVGGRGLATEAAHLVLHLAFDRVGLRRMIARLDADNEASAQLCRRLGMRQEAHLVENEWFKGRLSDELDFAMLSREWTALHATPRERTASWCPIRVTA